MNQQTNVFLPCLDRFFVMITEWQHENWLSSDDESIHTTDRLRQCIKEALNHFERQALERLVDAELIHKTKYALVAFIDEWIIRKLGSRSSAWITNPLQLEYFGENTAGERFFSQLASLRLQGEKTIDALEIYYLCLELGYEGQYRLNGQPVLLQLKKELLSQIQQTRKIDDWRFSIPISVTKTYPATISQFPWRKLVLMVASVVFVVAMSYMSAISYQASQDRKMVSRAQHQWLARN